jgi:hypothetical protein
MASGGSSALMAPRVDRTIGSRTPARWGAPWDPSGSHGRSTANLARNTDTVQTPEPRLPVTLQSLTVQPPARDLVSTRTVGTAPAGD